MFSQLARLALTVTALAPVFLTYGWAVWSANPTLGVCLMLAAIGLGALCALLLLEAQRSLESVPVQITAAEAADRENIAFLLLYISPLFADTPSDLNWAIWLPVLIVFGITIATGYNYHFSPVLGFLGWHSYKVTSADGITHVLLTKRQLRNTVGKLDVRQLTEYVIIESNKAK